MARGRRFNEARAFCAGNRRAIEIEPKAVAPASMRPALSAREIWKCRL